MVSLFNHNAACTTLIQWNIPLGAKWHRVCRFAPRSGRKNPIFFKFSLYLKNIIRSAYISWLNICIVIVSVFLPNIMIIGWIFLKWDQFFLTYASLPRFPLLTTERVRYIDTDHRTVSLIALRHNILTFEPRVYYGLKRPGKKELMTYVVAYSTAFKMTQEDLLWEVIFHLGLLRFNPGDQQIEWNKSLTTVFRKRPMLIFVKMLYETTIPSATCRHLKFHYENLISFIDLTCFERLSTKKYCDVRDPTL